MKDSPTTASSFNAGAVNPVSCSDNSGSCSTGFVRPARVEHAPRIGEIHARGLRSALGRSLAGDGEAIDPHLADEIAATIDSSTIASQWHATLSTLHDQPEGAAILVATEDDPAHVVGFTACLPTSLPPDVTAVVAAHSDTALGANTAPTEALMMTALDVDEAHTHRGHGSRLLAAVSDMARADHRRIIATWILAGDTARIRFFSSAGFGPAGASRTMIVAGQRVVEHLWWCEMP